MKKLALFFLFLSQALMGQTGSVIEINQKLGKGINMGNMFEAPSEGEWGNPFREDYFAMIAELGFDHVRIPIRWDTPARSQMTAPYTIHPDFLQRIQEVVDLALTEGLMVIINMHHHDELFQQPNAHKDRFLAQWKQISDYFKEYPETLLFEVMNEPHDQLTPDLWNVFFANALAEIRKTNPTRTVLMGTADFGGVSGIFYLDPPEDDHIIVTVHYYNPFSFTHQGAEWVGEQSQDWLGTRWYDLEYERETVMQEMEAVVNFSNERNIPIHMGEFGAYSQADMESRRLWTGFMARYFESLGFSWAYWEWSAGFGIYDPQADSYREPLVEALLHAPLGEPREAYPQIIYESNFDGSNDGWSLFLQQGAQATLSREDGGLKLEISQLGQENWHVQLAREELSLEMGKIYRVSFVARSEEPLPVTHYLGKASSPFNAYSGYQNFVIQPEEREYAYVFNMNDPDDPAARMVLDLGSKATNIWLDSFKLEQLNFLIASIPELTDKQTIKTYPNPVDRWLYLEVPMTNVQADVIALSGKHMDSFVISDTHSAIDLGNLPTGVYVLRLIKDNRWQARLRLIKK
jgi:aryl-phospho-beta-D-glucosidase BglC (GH1 family)